MAGRAEIRSLTGLRGIAAIHVMFYHYLGSGDHVAHNFLDHGYLAVDLFFALSGFVMGLIYAEEFRHGTTPAKFFNFLTRRVARVYPLYLFTTVLAAALISVGLLEYRGHHLFVDLPMNLLMVQSWFHHDSLDAPGWSISAEWAVYLVFPWLAAITLSRKKWLLVLVLLIAVVLVPVSFPSDRLIAQGIPVLRCLSAFTLGLFAYRMTLVPRIGALREIPWLEPLVVAFYVGLMCFPHTDIAIVFMSPIVIFVLSLDRGIVSQLLRKRLVHRLGVLSFSIYLIHDMLGHPMERIHRLANERGFHHGQLIAALFAVPLSIALAELACRWIEMPARRALRHIGPIPDGVFPRQSTESKVGGQNAWAATKLHAKRAFAVTGMSTLL